MAMTRRIPLLASDLELKPVGDDKHVACDVKKTVKTCSGREVIRPT